MNSRRTFKLYVNQKHQRFWDIIKFAESQGVNPSDYICKTLINNFNEEMPEPKKPVIPALLDVAQDYQDHGVDGCMMSYKIPKMFDKNQISKEDMMLLTIFSIQLYITVLKNDGIQKILDVFPEKMLRTKRDIESLKTIDEFRTLLSKYMVLNMDRLQKEEQDRIKDEQDNRLKRQRESMAERLRADKKEWEKQNPGKPYWQKGMSDEEIETSNKLYSGEWEIYDDTKERYADLEE